MGLMLRPKDTQVTAEAAREICQRTGGSAVLEGSIARLGDQYALELRGRNCQTGDILAAEQTDPGAGEGAGGGVSRPGRGEFQESHRAIAGQGGEAGTAGGGDNLFARGAKIFQHGDKSE
jgi:hypothetical protein